MPVPPLRDLDLLFDTPDLILVIRPRIVPSGDGLGISTRTKGPSGTGQHYATDTLISLGLGEEIT